MDGLESPGHINRLAWAWVREYVRDLKRDYANRINFD